MDGFERRKEQSKAEIRKAAGELFGQFGVDKVSIMDIANKAGVSQATIYNNFGSKEALVREFVNGAVAQLSAGVRDAVASGHSYPEKMAAFFGYISTLLADGKPSDSGSAAFVSSLDLQNDPEIRKIRLQAEDEMIALLLGVIEEGKQQGQVSRNFSEAALRIYFTAFMNMFTHPEFQKQYVRHPEIVGEVGALLMYGLHG